MKKLSFTSQSNLYSSFPVNMKAKNDCDRTSSHLNLVKQVQHSYIENLTVKNVMSEPRQSKSPQVLTPCCK